MKITSRRAVALVATCAMLLYAWTGWIMVQSNLRRVKSLKPAAESEDKTACNGDLGDAAGLASGLHMKGLLADLRDPAETWAQNRSLENGTPLRDATFTQFTQELLSAPYCRISLGRHWV